MTPEDMKKLWMGAAVGGTGVGALSVLVDAIRSERRRVNAESGGGGGETMDIILPTNGKQANLPEILGALAIAAGGAGGVRALWNKYRQKQLREEVDQSSQGYIDAVAANASKQANIDVGSFFWNAPRDAAIILPALAAAGTYGLLEHTFPKPNEKKLAPAGMPKRIRIRGYGDITPDGKANGPLAKQEKKTAPVPVEAEEEIEKAASLLEFSFGIEDLQRSAESLCLMLTACGTLKEANSAVTELLGAYRDDPDSISGLVKEAGVLSAISAAKGGTGTYYDLDEIGKREVVKAAFADPVMAPSLASLLIAEYHEMVPEHAAFAKIASETPGGMVLAAKYASVTHMIDTQGAAPNTKLASGDLDREMASFGLVESKDVGGNVDEADEVFTDRKDPIDLFMAGKKIS